MATIFHWPLSEMTPMTVGELMDWRERARVRSGDRGEE
ncbi:GpE family phage tail protein [Halorhodospira neutriphila]